MEIPSTPECPAVDRGVNVGDSIRNGIGLDDKWKHQ